MSVEGERGENYGSPEDRCPDSDGAGEKSGNDHGEKETCVGGEQECGSAGESEHVDQAKRVRPRGRVTRLPPPPSSALAFAAAHRVSDQPEHRGPEADEEGSAFGVGAFVLADRLGSEPEGDAEEDRSEGEAVEVVAPRSQVLGVG